MGRIQANGIEFEYDETGPKDGEPVVLVMGFTAQMTRWPDEFRGSLADHGYRVIRFDNRDIGLSHQFEDKGMPDTPAIIGALQSGGDATALAPYLLNDMAADVAGIIGALNLGPSHVIGASMGGMIVQLLALNHPEVVRSLIPVMTTSGDPSLPQATPKAMEALTAQPASQTRDDVVKHGVWSAGIVGSDPSVINSDDALEARIASDYDRAYRPLGVARQYAAILAQPRWHDRLSSLDVPAMVLHGAIDPLIPPEGGRDIARRIPGARMVELDKWGHDMPAKMVPTLVETVAGFLAETRQSQPA